VINKKELKYLKYLSFVIYFLKNNKQKITENVLYHPPVKNIFAYNFSHKCFFYFLLIFEPLFGHINLIYLVTSNRKYMVKFYI
jgi:hypothetical protein